MRRLQFLAFASMATAFASASIASSSGCSTPGSEFDAGLDDDGTPIDPADANASSGGGGNTSSGGSIPSSDADNTSKLPPDLEECGADQLNAELRPVELVLLLDKSSSMCTIPGGNPGGGTMDCASPFAVWPAAEEAGRAFMTSPLSAGMSLAVIEFGPIGSAPGINLQVATNRCTADNYAEPSHPAQDLPSQPLANAVFEEHPIISSTHAAQDYNRTQTQTGGVIGGGLAYMTARRAAPEFDKDLALLLVTDGQASGCGTNAYNPTDADHALAVEAATAVAAAGYKLYVLNITQPGSPNPATYEQTVTRLNQLAMLGGTEQAITVNDPSNAQQIGQALAAIRGTIIPCEMDIPVTPSGVLPKLDELNVTLTPPGGEAEVLPQTTDCEAIPRAWRYDNPDDPKKIQLCEGACQAAQATVDGVINVVLGCATITGPIN